MELHAYAPPRRSIAKISRIMKLTTLMLIGTFLQVSAKTNAQTVTLSEKNAPMEKVFNLIKKQTGYLFWYKNNLLKDNPRISIEVKDAPLKEALELCFKDQPFTYDVVNKTIVVKPKQERLPAGVNDLLGIDVHGIVRDETGKAVAGATVQVKGDATKGTSTDDNGYFELNGVEENATLVISGAIIEPFEIKVNGRADLGNVRVTQKQQREQNIMIDQETGYQQIPKERATGSFDFIDNKLLNRKVSPNILDHIENLSPGVLFDHDANATDRLLIRGRSTIFANAAPLIVLDNFAYDGDIKNINPNDVENITILKDAAAASIWGARAGNGVIVITTKKGTTAKPRITFNTSITFVQKPDLFNLNTISSADYIDLEKYLFTNGNYSTEELFNRLNFGHPPFTPVVELLIKARDGKITQEDAEKQIESFKTQDVRNDIEKYLYRPAQYHQYALSISGNTNNLQYYLSGGLDVNNNTLKADNNNRVTLRSQTKYRITPKLSAEAVVAFTQNKNEQGNNPGYQLSNGGGKSLYPYATLYKDGETQNIVRNYNNAFTDTAGQGALLNWKYNPIDDIGKEKRVSTTRDYLLHTSIRYQLLPELNAEIRYQYKNATTNTENLYKEDSYYARNLINNFTQRDATTGNLYYPVPLGGILDEGNEYTTSHQGRVQLNFNKKWQSVHELNAIAGYEIKSLNTNGQFYRMYGYSSVGNIVATQMDFSGYYTQYSNPRSQVTVPNTQYITSKTDHFISYYFNTAYSYKQRYTLSVSAREDQANLFGVKTNQKGVPLWSTGILWDVNREKFYKSGILPLLQFRLSYGYNGNISRLSTAYTTAVYSGALTTPAVAGQIRTIPNENLRWEQVGIMNASITFATARNIISGTIEGYLKNAKYLIGSAPIDPTTGQSSFYGNVAAMKGKGIDMELQSLNLNGRFKWSTQYIFSYAFSKVTDYYLPVSANGGSYMIQALNQINPVKGRPVFSIYSYEWGGLTHDTGDPQGYIDGKLSTDYTALTNETPLSKLIYNGPVTPPYFGSLRNTFTYGSFNFSFLLSFKAGYWFRRQSIDYGALFSTWSGNGDYADRWQNPGDELKTNVISMVYPANSARNNFYSFSEVLVEKGDHVRLEDITLSYDIDKRNLRSLPIQSLHLYLTANNIGTICYANKDHIDPYYVDQPSQKVQFSAGLQMSF